MQIDSFDSFVVICHHTLIHFKFVNYRCNVTIAYFKFEISECINTLCVFNFVMLRCIITLICNKNKILKQKEGETTL